MKRPVKLILAILTVGLIAVGSTSSTHAASGAESFNSDRTVSTARAQAIDRAARAFLAGSSDGTQGLWLAVWDPKRGYFEKAYGRAVAGGRKASTKDTFYIGSITKAALATAVLQQVAEGSMKLTDTVADLDPELATRFPSIAPVDVRNLLGMTSGIPDYADASVAQVLVNPQQRFSRDDLIALGLARAPQEPIGTAGYSTTNYIILGQLLKAATGRSPERLVNHVFRQAGMTNARLPVSSAERPARLSHGYLGNLLPSALPGMSVPDAATDVTSWVFDWGKEGGGAFATIGDLAVWGSTCVGNTLLPKDLARQRLVTNTNATGDYGLGIIRQGNWLGHNGQVLGWTAVVACNPKSGAVVAYATNSSSGVVDVPDFVGKAAFPEYLKAIRKS